MDRQKVFDTIARGIIAQAALGFSAGGSFYQTTDGRKCGIGHLIPDSLYDARLEDCNVAQLPGYILEAIGR